MAQIDLNNVKVGDTLLYYTCGHYSPVDRLTVVRTTKTLLITDKGRFSKSTGYAYPKGQSYNCPRILTNQTV